MTLSVSLQHRFGTFDLDIAFEAPAGVTALFGSSGSGKTTLVNAVAGLLRPDQGRIALDGTVLLDTASRTFLPPHRRQVGYVFQDARLFPHLSVRRNLLYGRWVKGKRAQGGPALGAIADLLGIAPLLDRQPGGLSGGERQRVALGRALLSNPRMLLMDEPLAALDEARKAEILPYLERLRDEIRLPILYVSHAPAEIARLATTVIVIGTGRIRATGTAAQVLSDPAIALNPTDTGSLLSARVTGIEDDGLTRLDSAAGPLFLGGVTAAPGSPVRLRIPAQDVVLSRDRPQGLSTLNILQGRVDSLHPEGTTGMLVRLDLGGEFILARITARSARALELAPGAQIHAMVKAVALLPAQLGQMPETRPAP